MPVFEKHFTVAEANALIPEVREIVEQIRGLRDVLAEDLERMVPILRASRMNGGGKAAGPYLNDIQKLNARLTRLAELGVQLKDVEMGLVDFPAWRAGEEVLLCWKLGEDAVRYWHDLESGYRGRKPLP